jgi:hypothetical protein
MPASIWLQPDPAAAALLQKLVRSLAAEHGTPPFQPHLTVCNALADPSIWQGTATDYVKNSALPFVVRKMGISSSAEIWSQSLIIDLVDDPALRRFREDLQRLTGGGRFHPPHISLLYALDGSSGRRLPSLDAARLHEIAEDCAARLTIEEFHLARPVVVTTDGNWTNIRSWRVMRTLWGAMAPADEAGTPLVVSP